MARELQLAEERKPRAAKVSQAKLSMAPGQTSLPTVSNELRGGVLLQNVVSALATNGLPESTPSTHIVTG